MSERLANVLTDLRQEGARRFAAWQPDLFDAVACGPGLTLWQALAEQPDAEAVFRGYLCLVQEAVGTAALRSAAAPPAGTPWSSFLERFLVQLVPDLLANVPSSERLPLLVKGWNLGEGLLGEPEWVDRYVNACAGRLRKLGDLEKFLVEALTPVLTPAPPSSWEGPFAVTVLDLRSAHDDFLPGALSLAAPTVLCVQDRRLPHTQVGVLLRPKRKSELLGLTQGLSGYEDAGPRPAVTIEDGRARVGEHVIALPHLRRCSHSLVARAGFVVASALDSQRLWIVEAA